MFGLFYFDPTVLIVLPALLISIWAQIKVSTTYRKYSAVYNKRNVTGHDAARAILDRNGLHYVKIEHVRGHLTDHYDPKANVCPTAFTAQTALPPSALPHTRRDTPSNTPVITPP